MWDLIVSVPDHCLSFYFDLLSSFIQDSADKHIPSITSRSVSSAARFVCE